MTKVVRNSWNFLNKDNYICVILWRVRIFCWVSHDDLWAIYLYEYIYHFTFEQHVNQAWLGELSETIYIIINILSRKKFDFKKEVVSTEISFIRGMIRSVYVWIYKWHVLWYILSIEYNMLYISTALFIKKHCHIISSSCRVGVWDISRTINWSEDILYR